MKRVFVSFIVMLISLTMTASAISLTSWYDPASCRVNATGDGDGIITIIVAPEAVSSDSISVSNMPSYFHQIEAGGSYNFSFPLPDSAADGKYIVYVYNQSGSASGSFISYDISVANSIISDLNSKSSEDFILITSSDAVARSLGIDVTNEDYSLATMTLMRKLYPSFTDSIDFLNKYNFCHALNSLSGKSVSEVENNLKKYQSFLGISYIDDYESKAVMSSGAKKDLCSYLSTVDYVENYVIAQNITGNKDFKALYNAAQALAVIKQVQNWKSMEKIYTQTYSFLKTNIVNKNSSYSASISDSVFEELNKLSFEKISDLKNNFDKAVAAALLLSEKSADTKDEGYKGTVSLPSSSPSGSSSFEQIPVSSASNTGITCSLPEDKGKKISFTDVLSDTWFFDAVSTLASMDIVSGYNDGSFVPEGNITRAEFTKMMVAAFNINSKNKGEFSDVNADDWFSSYVGIASGAGIITGYDGFFNPSSFITRQDAVLILSRVAPLFDVQYTGFREFSDMNDVSLYAWSAVGAFYSNGLVNGTEEQKFYPQSHITRAEAAQLLLNFITNIKGKI